MNIEKIKQALGAFAATFIQEGMVVGLGSGTTAAAFISSLIARCSAGLSIQVVPSSQASLALALQGGLSIRDLNEVGQVDITVDGADEIDESKRMIKGGGGCLLREKILASASREMIVMVSEDKIVSQLGTKPLPVEIVSFGAECTRKKLAALGYEGRWRMVQDLLFVTENGHRILDIYRENPFHTPEEDHERIRSVPGVVETGFFFQLAGRVLVGRINGEVKIWD